MSMPGFWELALLAVLALLIFGPDRLPGMLRSAGRTVGTVRREARTALDELKHASDFDEVRAAAKELRDEGEALRREGQEATRTLGALSEQPQRDDRAARDPARPAADAAAEAPAPYDPDVP